MKNQLARTMHRLPVVNQAESSIVTLLNKETIAKLAKNFWGKTWVKFMTFGTTSVKRNWYPLYIAKSILDVVVKDHTLHTIFR